MKKLLVSAAGIASVLSLCALPSQVHAGADGSQKDILGIAGSDTTTFVMEALAAAHNTNSRYNPNKDRAVNIPPLVAANPNVETGESTATSANKAWLADARSTWPGGYVLPADNDCKVNMVFGGFGSRDLNTDGDTADGAVGTPATWEGATIATADLNGDSDTADVGETWYLGVVPPNGSGAGRNAMEGTAQNGVAYNGSSSPGGTANSACIDIARSSSKSFSAKREGWAFALDAIDWTYFPQNTHGVTTGLTKTQLGKIYTCFSGTKVDPNGNGIADQVGDRIPGYPEYSLWGDVTGVSTDTTPIKAYRVQLGSGTGTDVATTLIGKASNNDNDFLANCDGYGGVDRDGNGATSFTPFTQVQEHDCRSVSDANKPDAICFYGYSRWVIQAKSLETDKRNGAVFGKFSNTGDPKRPSFSSINETSARFEGTRYVYNYIGLNTDGSGEDFPRIADARRFVGVSLQPAGCSDGIEGGTDDCNFDGDTADTGVAVGGVPGFICGDLIARKIIAAYGFKPLPLAATDPANGAYGTSYCRLNTSASVPAF